MSAHQLPSRSGSTWLARVIVRLARPRRTGEANVERLRVASWRDRKIFSVVDDTVIVMCGGVFETLCCSVDSE
jgi:hypothetical protein